MLTQDAEARANALQMRAEQLMRWRAIDANWDPNARECPVLYPNPANHVKFPHFDTDVLLLQASSSSDPADVELFLRRDGNPNVHDLLGVSALHRAAMMNDVATINVLIQYGANIEQQDVDGWTPLFAAVHFGSTAATRALLDHDANLLAVDRNNCLVMDICEQSDITKLLKNALDEHGVSSSMMNEARSHEAKSLLKEIEKCKQEKRPLSSIHIDANEAVEGATPLHLAACKGYMSVARACLHNGANINAQDTDGWTPLHAASYWDQYDVAKYLIGKGCHLDDVTYDGNTPLDFAQSDEMANLLTDAIKKRNKRGGALSNDYSSSSLPRSVNDLDSSVSLNFADENGDFPLSPVPGAGSSGTLPKGRLTSKEMAHIDTVTEKADFEMKRDSMVISGEVEGVPTLEELVQRTHAATNRQKAARRSLLLLTLFMCIFFFLLLAAAAAGGVLVGLSGMCLPFQPCGTPLTTPCLANTACNTCADQTGCVWCAQWTGTDMRTALGGASCVKVEAAETKAAMLAGDEICLTGQGTNGTVCGSCLSVFDTQCLLPSPLLHILLIVCAAVAGVSLIVSIALFSRRFICRPRRRSQFFDESQDFIYDSSSSGPNQKYISHLIPPMQKSGSLSAIKMQRRG